MPCLRLLRLEAALPSGVFAPPTPVRSPFRRQFSRPGLTGRLARGCLVFGGAASDVGGAGASGVPVGWGSVDRVPGSLDSELASGVPGACGGAASMGREVGSAGVLSGGA